MGILQKLWLWSERPIETLGRAAFVIALAGIVSRLLGFIRDRLLASSFGAGDLLDAYYVAFRLPDLIYGFLVLGALSAAFIPVFTELIAHEERERAWRLVQGAIQWLVIFLGGAAIIGMIFASELALLIAPGFSPEKQSLVALLTRIMLISPIFLSVSAVFGGVLVSFKQFIAYSFAPVFYNLGIIIGIVFFFPVLGPIGLAWGVVLGAFLHMSIQFPAFRRAGYRLHFVPLLATWRDTALQKVVRLMVPRSLTVAINQLSLVIVTVFASTLASGSLAAFTLAINIQSIPLGLFGIAFSLASFPILSSLAAKKEHGEFFKVFSQTVKRILYFVIPLSFLLIIFRAEIVRIVLGTGAFNWEDTILTFTVLGWLSFSLFAQCLIPLFVRAFFALQDTRTPLYAALAAEGIHLSLIPFLLPRYEIAGLAMAFSIGSIVNILILYVALRRRLEGWKDREIALGVSRIFIVSLVAALIAQYSKGIFALTIGRLDTFIEVAAKFGMGAVIGTVTYLMLSSYFKLPEYLQIKRFIWCRLLRQPETVALTEDHPEKGSW